MKLIDRYEGFITKKHEIKALEMIQVEQRRFSVYKQAVEDLQSKIYGDFEHGLEQIEQHHQINDAVKTNGDFEKRQEQP